MSALPSRMTSPIFPLFLAVSLVPLPARADDPTVNRLLASQCAQCHGTNGYAVGDFENLAGEEAGDLVEDLADMKREDRPENIMDHQALGYTDAQIRRIAAFYATLPEDEGRDGSAGLDGSERYSGREARTGWEEERDEWEEREREALAGREEERDEWDERERNDERDEDD
jgi:sulfide dehydrogenase cytochrome subunit